VDETDPGIGLARPFLKYPGGKSALASIIVKALLPKGRVATYYEPMVGGGAVFFELARRRVFDHAVLGDANAEVINVYEVIRDEVQSLIRILMAHQARFDVPSLEARKAYYYELRAVNPATVGPVVRAARTIALNKTCFNGLFRFNKSGRFNVPYGQYPKPCVLHEGVLRAASEALRGVSLHCADFSVTVARAGKGSAIYFDPPYVPTSTTAQFTAYTGAGFKIADHEQLRSCFEACVSRGAHCVASNSITALPIWKSAPHVRIDRIEVRRAINSIGDKRGPVTELLVTSIKGERRGPREPSEE